MRKIAWMLLALLIGVAAAGCSKEAKPEEVFADYVKQWNGQHWEKMYASLSNEAQQSISKEEFKERYEKIYADLEVKDLKVDFKKPEKVEEKDGKTEFPFHVKMNTVAGEIAFDHTTVLKEEERDDAKKWLVDWDTTYIFPELEEGDKISLPTVSAKRGDILDRNGTGMAVTGKATEIGLIPGEMGDKKDEILKNVSGLLNMSEEKIEKQLSASWVEPEHFVPVAKILADDQALLEKLTEIPSVNNRTVEARVYPLGEAAAHLIGYVGPVTAEDLEKEKGYQNGDVIGKRGLEQVLEKKLKGENGAKIIIKKEDGTEEVLAEKEVKDGDNVQLTIDAALQSDAFKQFKKDAGTAAAINPVSGETLALVSSPSFDPNKLSLGASGAEWEKLEKNKQHPLATRFKNTYAPGSVMKPITAAIGLDAGAIDWKETINVKGKSWQKDKSWGGYTVTRVTDPKGPVGLEKALVLSDNIFFAQAALDLGKKEFAAGLERFGFEEEIPDYAYPLQPSQIGKMDSEVAVADSGYGQGQIEMNIVHLATTYSAFANKGSLVQPTLLKDDKNSVMWKKNAMTEKTAADLQKALRKVVDDPKGTAHSAQLDGVPLAGKTGTAELKTKKGEEGKENGFFVAFNPEKPDLLVAMMVEDVKGRGGSQPAIDKVKNLFKE